MHRLEFVNYFYIIYSWFQLIYILFSSTQIHFINCQSKTQKKMQRPRAFNELFKSSLYTNNQLHFDSSLHNFVSWLYYFILFIKKYNSNLNFIDSLHTPEKFISIHPLNIGEINAKQNNSISHKISIKLPKNRYAPNISHPVPNTSFFSFIRNFAIDKYVLRRFSNKKNLLKLVYRSTNTK